MNLRVQSVKTIVDGAATVVCALAALMTLGNLHSPTRSGLTLVALVLGTGWAATCWIDIRETAMAATVTIATGISVLCLYALLFVEAGWWHPVGCIGGLLIAAAGINAMATIWHLTRGNVL